LTAIGPHFRPVATRIRIRNRIRNALDSDSTAAAALLRRTKQANWCGDNFCIFWQAIGIVIRQSLCFNNFTAFVIILFFIVAIGCCGAGEKSFKLLRCVLLK